VDTTWNTLDKTGNNARRALAYGVIDGSGKESTKLKNSVAAGATVLPVNSDANFNVADSVVIGSGNTAEVREITAIASNNLTINAPLSTGHAFDETVKELSLEIYLALECINIPDGYNVWEGTWYAKDLRVTFSATWDAIVHNYPSSNQQSFIMYQLNSTGEGSGRQPD